MLPGDLSILERSEPIYEVMPGWSEPSVGAREFADLPKAAQRYIERLSELVGCEIGIVSTGPDRAQTIIRGRSALASWFAS
jgi:adenylosuccinate synthase